MSHYRVNFDGDFIGEINEVNGLTAIRQTMILTDTLILPYAQAASRRCTYTIKDPHFNEEGEFKYTDLHIRRN